MASPVGTTPILVAARPFPVFPAIVEIRGEGPLKARCRGDPRGSCSAVSRPAGEIAGVLGAFLCRCQRRVRRAGWRHRLSGWRRVGIGTPTRYQGRCGKDRVTEADQSRPLRAPARSIHTDLIQAESDSASQNLPPDGSAEVKVSFLPATTLDSGTVSVPALSQHLHAISSFHNDAGAVRICRSPETVCPPRRAGRGLQRNLLAAVIFAHGATAAFGRNLFRL